MNKKLVAFIKTRTFFALVLIFFLINSVWIALSARFPMAFDEGFHLGIIKVYSHQISPLLLRQPPGAAPYGALTTDPSYIYHYLMSFPYRWLTQVFADPKTVIISLRFINIAFFMVALVLMRQVLLKTKASIAVVHATLLIFVLIPIVPLLAGQINYDNLLFLLLSINLLLVIYFRDQLQRKKQCNTGFLMHILSFAMLGSLVKFAYLPFLLAIAIYIFYILAKTIGSPRKVWRSFLTNWRSLTKVNRFVAATLLVFSLGLFLQRYGVAVVRYHNVIPQCGQVLDVQRCSAYPPWARNHSFAEQKHSVGLGNPVYFAGGWIYGMFNRSFFAINGPGPKAGYDNKLTLPLMSIAAATTFIFGLYLVYRYRKYVFKDNPVLAFLLFVSLVYVVALISRNYHDYLQLSGHMVAINGRYLIPIILPVLLAMAMAYQKFIKTTKRLIVFSIVVLLMLQGGGAVSFIYYSSHDWYWPNDQLSRQMNDQAKSIIDPLILGWPRLK